MKLNQILAKEKRLVSVNYAAITDFHKLTQKPALFNGFQKKYKPLAEGDETYPDESQKAQMLVGDVVVQCANLWTDMLDIVSTKDNANMTARADVVVNGKVIIEGAPVTFLLYLEKQLLDIRKHFDVLPTLDESETWIKDEESGWYRSVPVLTHRTKKTQRPIVLYDATDKHPAQTQLLTEDITVGHWETRKQSGAIPATRKRILLERVDVLTYAVKTAREQANAVEAEEVKVGKAIFDHLLAP